MAIKRRDWILIVVLLVLIGGILGSQVIKRQNIARRLNATDTPVQATAGAQATPLPFDLAVFVNGQLYAVSPLIAGEAINVEQMNGDTNVIRMTENGFYMEDSTCDGHDCIAQGAVTYQNWYQRILGNTVICLPNRVEVVLVVDETCVDAPDV